MVQYIPKQGLVSNRLGKSGARLPTANGDGFLTSI
jgi:hypothetical protein